MEQRRFPPLREVAHALGGNVTVTAVPIPRECIDGLLEAYWARPEALLDPEVRAAQSGWRFVDPATVRAGLQALADDLATGEWDRRHGQLRHQATYTGPLVLVTSTCQ